MRMIWPLALLATTPAALAASVSNNIACEDEFYTWSYMSAAQSVCQFSAETNVIIKVTGNQIQAHCKAVLTPANSKQITNEALKNFHKDETAEQHANFCKKTEDKFIPR